MLKPLFAGVLFVGVLVLSIASTVVVAGGELAGVSCCESPALSR